MANLGYFHRFRQAFNNLRYCLEDDSKDPVKVRKEEERRKRRRFCHNLTGFEQGAIFLFFFPSVQRRNTRLPLSISACINTQGTGVDVKGCHIRSRIHIRLYVSVYLAPSPTSCVILR